jgi:hypothetical protein
MKRQATQHGCLLSFLGNGDKGIEIVYGEEKKIYCTGPTRAAMAEQKLIVPARHDKPNEPIKKGPLSFVLF